MNKFKLIITGDDYGVHKVVDDAILDGIDKGVINSVTVLMNLPRSTKALRRLAKHLIGKKLTKKIGVGIHLNITTGSPIVKTTNSALTRRNGNFHTLSHYLSTTSDKLENEIQISKELIGQIDLFLTILEDYDESIPLDHFTSQHNILISINKYAKIVGVLSYFFAAHGKYFGKPIPIRKPMPLGKEFGSGHEVSPKVKKIRKDTWDYLKNNTSSINSALYALMKYRKAKFDHIVGSTFNYNGIRCPHLMFLSFFGSHQNSRQKIISFQNMLNDLYSSAVKSKLIKKDETLIIEIIHHVGRDFSDDEQKEVEKISGFDVDYFIKHRPIEFDLILSTEYQSLLKQPNVSHTTFSDLNR